MEIIKLLVRQLNGQCVKMHPVQYSRRLNIILLSKFGTELLVPTDKVLT